MTEYYNRLLRQLAIDYNCTLEDLKSEKVVITLPALNEGRRSYAPGMPFFQIVTLGATTVIMADECLHEFLYSLTKDTQGHHLLEFDSLLRINGELEKYGYEMEPTHHMFLPCREVRTEERFPVKWFYDSEITPFYGDDRFTNAIAYPAPCPVRPDRITVAALDEDGIMGMAGCSEDAPHWQQIGIDVLPRCRSKGVGTYLVTLLMNRIIEMGDIPFYGTACANIPSQRIAINSGFAPAWAETQAVRTAQQ